MATPSMKEIRSQFPLLSKKINGRPIVYFDNAATSQKPLSVIKAITEYYTMYNCNIHRGTYKLSMDASQLYDQARATVAKFINAEPEEIIFTSGTTESINMLAKMLTKISNETIITEMEHHSNILPHIMKSTDHSFSVIPIDGNCDLDQEEFLKLISYNGKMPVLCVSHISNAIGTVNPVKEMIAQAHEKNIPVFIDAAQSFGHRPIDVKELDCDFMAFSGHKAYAPTGIGVLYINKKYHEVFTPAKTGGGMAEQVKWNNVIYKEAPEKFEAGTPNMEGAIGLMVACEYMTNIGLQNIEAQEKMLTAYALKQLATVKGMNIVGDPKERAGIISFTIDGIKNVAVGKLLDKNNICARIGFHCTHPLMFKLNKPEGTIRISFAVYNTKEEIDYLIRVLKTLEK